MNEWSDEQLKIVLNAACRADNGCSHCVSLVLSKFFQEAGFDLIDRMEKLSIECDLPERDEWKDIMPKYQRWGKPIPNDSKYISAS